MKNAPAYPTRAPKVLIVDDDPICRLVATELLKGYCEIETVTNGHDALEAVEKETYDAVLMDINLNNPAMCGIRTMRMIKDNRKNRKLPIMAVTASSTAKEWFLKEGFDGHFQKPLIQQEIIEELIKKLKPLVAPQSN
jgi:CheY-like chemotaxis protein